MTSSQPGGGSATEAPPIQLSLESGEPIEGGEESRTGGGSISSQLVVNWYGQLVRYVKWRQLCGLLAGV